MDTCTITVSELNLTSVAGQLQVVRLRAPLTVPHTISAAALCRLVLPRLPLSPYASLLFGLVLEETLEGLTAQHTYTELGSAFGRGTHTVIRAAAELRGAGLLFSRRVGFKSGLLSFVCTPLVAWAEATVGRDIAQDAPERPSELSAASKPSVTSPSPRKATAAAEDAPTIPLVTRRAMAYVDEIVDDHPDWPAVPGDWRGRYGIPLPDDDDAPSMAVPLHVKPWLGPIPRRPDGTLDIEKLVRMPHQFVGASGDDEAIHAFCQEKGDRQTGPVVAMAEEHDVDASAEREAELALSGPNADTGDDFNFSTGSDTADTDVGHGVVPNPDL